MQSTKPTFTRERPSGILKFGFKAAGWLYRGWLAELFNSRCVMLLTTTGRKSGLPRTGGVSYMRLDDRVVSFSGFGVGSNWYRNLLANPEVIIQLGRRHYRATAKPVEDPDRRQELILRMRDYSSGCGPPTFVRPFLRLTRAFNYDAEIALAVEHARDLPVIEFFPHDEL